MLLSPFSCLVVLEWGGHMTFSEFLTDFIFSLSLLLSFISASSQLCTWTNHVVFHKDNSCNNGREGKTNWHGSVLKHAAFQNWSLESFRASGIWSHDPCGSNVKQLLIFKYLLSCCVTWHHKQMGNTDLDLWWSVVWMKYWCDSRYWTSCLQSE